jgi:uncharacterized protein
MQDPLSELVKIDPANIGVGLYQHDVKAKHLRTSLDAVVESCVNYVGVDLNTASPALLRYVSGLNQLTARRVYDHRTASGPFKSREQLKEVSGFGEATFVQAAGFLKISDGDNPLDGTWIHPESYEIANRVLEKLGCSPAELTKKEAMGELAGKAGALDLDELAAELNVGPLLLKDIVAQLTRPGRDPREDLPAPIFKRGILKLEDLTPAMELYGVVLNVVDFGAFVDIGLHDSGLVHVSQIANRYVRDPHEVVAVGDIVKVWVMEIDKSRRRVSLTMISPGTRRGEGSHRRHGGKAEEQDGDQSGQRRPRRHRRPPKPDAAVAVGGTPGADSTGQPVAAPDVATPNEATTGAVPPGTDAPQIAARADQPATQRPAPPRPQFQRGGPRKPHGPPHGRPQYRPKPKPAPLIPITDAMKKGKEPLRTFGDLKQFYEFKSQEPETPSDPTQK